MQKYIETFRRNFLGPEYCTRPHNYDCHVCGIPLACTGFDDRPYGIWLCSAECTRIHERLMSGKDGYFYRWSPIDYPSWPQFSDNAPARWISRHSAALLRKKK